MKTQSKKYAILVLKVAFILVLSLLILAVRQQNPLLGRTQAETWYVDQNCTVCGAGTINSPFQTIRPSLTYAVEGDTVLVAQGTYTEHVSIKKPLTIMGGYSATLPNWTRDISQFETVIVSDDRGRVGEWDGDWLGAVAVVKDGSTYRIWYTGGNELYGERIGYADSPDGVNWFTPLDTPLLSPGPAGSWDERDIADPFVLKTASGFQMWYVGMDAEGQRAIGTAFSNDGITWLKYGLNPILRSDSTDEDGFGFPVVVQDGASNYHLWYSGWDKIWHATSPDGLNWTKNLDTAALSPGALGSWDDILVYAPFVTKSDSGGSTLYEMWYVGEGSISSESAIGYAWSVDGLTWIKSTVNPVLAGNPGDWEAGVVSYPVVLKEGDTDYKMWYRGGMPGTQAYGQAVSNDGVNWSRYDYNPLLEQGLPTLWGNTTLVLPDTSGAAVLDGFTITGGFAEFGGGIYATLSSATIRNCKVINNVSRNSGAGIYIYLSALTIENTIVSSNKTVSGWAGGIYISEASSVILGSVVTNNSAKESGGGMVIRKNSVLTFVDTVIASNTARRGGGIFLDNGSTLNMDSSRIDSNTAGEQGGLRIDESTVVMTNTFIVDNNAVGGDAGGLGFDDSFGRLVNVTVAGNSASEDSGGIYFRASDPSHVLEVLNSIVVFNDTDDFDCSQDDCIVSYSDIEEPIPGTGNISVDPGFVNWELGDYHLLAGSPVINMGTSIGAPLTDFEGDPRPIGGVDMGADEVITIYSQFVYVPFVVK